MTGRVRAAGLAVVTLMGVAVAGCGNASGSAGNSGAFLDPGVVKRGTLVAYDSCADALKGLRAALLANPYPYWAQAGGGMVVDDKAVGPVAPVPATAGRGEAAPNAYSGTNTQEVGVDEPDLVKTDGKRIVVAQGGGLKVIDTQSKELLAQVTYDPDGRRPANLLLSGDHVLVLTEGGYAYERVAVPSDTYRPGTSELMLIDIGGGGARVTAKYSFTGTVLTARQIGSTARVVLRSSPNITFPTDLPGTPQEFNERVKRAIKAAPIESFLPRYTTEAGGHTKSGQVDCANVARPATYSGTSMVSILTFDLSRTELGTGEPRTVVTDGDTVYASTGSLYLSNDSRWQAFPVDLPVAVAPAEPGAIVVDPAVSTSPSTSTRRKPAEPQTAIYKFDISGTDPARLVATGEVPGWTLNQYSFSEYNGDLRVATTMSAGTSQSGISVLRQRGNGLRLIGSVDGLGRGETIHAVRFLGPVGYVVTFRQTDPLYTVDLRDPTAPKVTGELKIPGFSSYLHPIADGRLIGLGQAATNSGQLLGTQLSLFDVTDPADPVRLDQLTLSQWGRSEAEWDPHAFLYWPDRATVVIPVMEDGARLFKVSGDELVDLGVVSHERTNNGYPPTIRRSLVVNGTLWTMSDLGLQANDLGTLARQGYVSFG